MSETYTAANIQILEGAAAIRRHPAMFIGGTGARGLHHLARELIDNAVDEGVGGHATHVWVRLHTDGSLSVTDDGRGIPTEPHPTLGRPACEIVMTRLHAGGKFDSAAYAVSGGTHGVGLSCVAALSERVDLHVWRDGRHWHQRYHRGEPDADLEDLGPPSDGEPSRGTRVRMWPDPQVFAERMWSRTLLTGWLRSLAHLVPCVAFTLIDEAAATTRTFDGVGGIGGLAADMADAPLHPTPVVAEVTRDAMRAQVALCWTAGPSRVLAFANTVPTERGGSHVQGLHRGLRALEPDAPWTLDDRLDGLVAVISVWHPDPVYEGQTKARLSNPELAGLVAEAVRRCIESLGAAERAAVTEHVRSAHRVAVASRQARAAVRHRAHPRIGGLAAKLADCQTGDWDHELFIVEGDSAGGSAKQARDRRTQAVLPLRGKVPNVERMPLDKVLAHAELGALVEALGCGVGPACDPERARYDRVVIMTDADVDGAHIRALLLTFFFRELRPLVEAGRLFVAQPPLYRVSHGARAHYLDDEAALQTWLGAHPTGRVQRFKGLGEMSPDQLWETTMDPVRRTLVRVDLDDLSEADRVFHALMGDDTAERRAMIEGVLGER